MIKKIIPALFIAVSANLLSGAVLLDAPGEVFIYNRQNREWTFPAVKPGKKVTVEFRHRIDFPKPAGWCPCWQIEVNGRKISRMGTRKIPRLLNKPFKWYHKHHGYFHTDNGSDKWYSLYLPDYHAADKYFVPENPEAARVILDISDLVRSDAGNSIRIRFGGVSENFYKNAKVTDRKPALAVKDFKVRDFIVPSPLKPVKKEVKRVEMTHFQPPPFSIGGGKDGLVLRVKDHRIPVVSRFSIPGGGWAELKGGHTLTTKYYTVKRRYVKHAGRIDFFDTVTSTSDKLIGLKIQYGTGLADFEPVYVAGDSNPSAAEFAGGRNPSVFGAIPAKNLGVGFIAVDDVLRVQNIARCSDKFFNIGTDTFALSPGESRTLEWSLYPSTADYFDFINAVRRDWKVNFPIAGSFNLSMNVYIRWNEEQAKSSSRCMGLAMNTFGVHYWSHLGRMDAKYKNYRDGIWGVPRGGVPVRAMLRDKTIIVEDPVSVNNFEKYCIEQAKKFTPEIKRLSYVHNMISVRADDEKFEDARLIDENGKKRTYGAPHTKLFVPTADNAWGRAFLDDIDWYLKNFDLDGLYWDEMNHTNIRCYYGDKMWDKVSAELDKNFNVKRKISFVPLLKLPVTLKGMDKILNEHKKMLVGNFSPETRSELRFQFPRFEETYSSRWIALSHLYTPIQLGDMLTYANTPRDMASDMRNALFRGALYYHYLGHTGCPSLTSRMFPFTPIELHSGWLLGEERILTALSGNFGWYGRNRLAQTFVFDELGREVPDYPAEISGTADGTRVKLELKKDHCAAVVAIPLEAELSGVTLSNVKYSGGKLNCTAAGKGFAVIKSGNRTQKFQINGTEHITF